MTNQPSRRRFLRGAGVAAAGSLLHPSIARALAIPAHRRTGTIKDVGHIVILMQENRSFDHYYGTLRGVQGFGDPHPVPLPGGRRVWEQRDKEGRTILPFHLDTRATAALKVADLPHGWEDANGASRQGRWDGWIPSKTQLTMGHYRREDIPFQFELAEAFTICDAYHCSVHGQTNPNRLFIWAGGNDPRGTGGGPVVANSSGVALDTRIELTPEMAEAAKRHNIDPAVMANYGKGPRYRYTTYPERLEQAGIRWKVYQDPKDNFWGLTNPAVAFQAYNDARPGEPLHDKAMSRWTIDDLRADVLADRLPQVVWITCSQSDSEHPEGSSPIEGANFTARVLDALTANPEVWSRTVLFLTFDENDGFFDHVPPPSPPAFNPDGSRAGASTVDTTDDIHSDKLPYGLSVRVPMTVISPWSTGGWVNSQVFDHTSVIRFVEARFGVKEPNITPWRRAVCGDLTSAFDFSRPQKWRATLPDTSDALARVQAALKLPKPLPPAQGTLPAQEPGIRPARALPYAPVLEEAIADGTLRLRFGNAGKAGLVYQVRDLDDLDALPRHYTVEPGKTLSDEWAVREQGYRLDVRGPNLWFRELRGRATDPLSVRCRALDDDALAIELINRGAETIALRCCDLLGGAGEFRLLVLPEGANWTVRIGAAGGWYDLRLDCFDGSPFSRRLSGRVETGRDSVSWPGRKAGSD
ncbi:phosphocholine-specific phospholipase C [Sphingomonas psychrotolerans]|uniref:phospholipase C n=1 Tax=Sphingomonas psychrotolerans TaxID=1327635 RepID=A0A2K8MJX5_9SPHN|nr:phospholipase C, phosphocholine-specific [Sphingomonas psychrotolerans]ATY34192.1 phospholipase C, phosphocholine-specific [Sphingomonas psychrotolerans]